MRVLWDENVWINKEHVWPVWLGQAVLAGTNAPHLRVSKGATFGELRRIYKTLDITAHCACRDKCNGGWMRQLEGDVQPFMRPMAIEGQVTLLNDERKALLAAWCIKTAMVYEFLNTENIKYFTPAERLHVTTYRRPPADVRLWLGIFQGPRRTHSWPHLQRLRGSHLAPTSYSLTLIAGRFIMQMLAVRNVQLAVVNARPRLDGLPDGMVMNLFPYADGALDQWPPKSEINEDNLNQFNQRFWRGDQPLKM